MNYLQGVQVLSAFPNSLIHIDVCPHAKSTIDCLSWSGAFPGRVCRAGTWSNSAHESVKAIAGALSDGALLPEFESGASIAARLGQHAEAIRDITEYIGRFDINERLNTNPGYLPPTVYGQAMAPKPPIEGAGIS